MKIADEDHNHTKKTRGEWKGTLVREGPDDQGAHSILHEAVEFRKLPRDNDKRGRMLALSRKNTCVLGKRFPRKEAQYVQERVGMPLQD